MKSLIIGIVLLWHFPVFAQKQNQESLAWPTDASQLMSSSFGEYRDNHFHSGIDIKTWGQTGYKVFAIADGWVSRIKVSPYGYGRALYITLHDGRTVVYGHLERFAQEIDDYVWNAQKNRGQYSVELWLIKGQFPVKKGQVVAYTGESGVGPAHLHFEIRAPDGEPVNPLNQGYNVNDSVRPTVREIVLTPLDAESAVDEIPLPRFIRVTATNGIARIQNSITVKGKIGIAFRAFDQADGAANAFNIYRASLKIGDSLWFETAYDKFGYDETRQIRLEREWRYNVQGKGVFTRLYRHPKNTLRFFAKNMSGLIDTDRLTQNPIPFNITIEDHDGNATQVIGDLIPKPTENVVDDDILLPDTTLFEAKDNQITLSESFFDNHVAITLLVREPINEIPRAWICSEGWEPLFLIPNGSKKWTAAVPIDFLHSGIFELHAEAITPDGSVFTGHHSWQQWIVTPDDNKTVEFPDAGFRMTYQLGSLWQPLCVRIDSTSAPVADIPYLTPVWLVNPSDIPLAGEISVQWKIPEGEDTYKQIGIYRWTRKDYWKILKPFEISFDGWITAPTDELGLFALIRDDVTPVVYPISPKDETTVSASIKKLVVSVSDMLSGFNDTDIRMFLDNEPVIAEFDPDARKIIYWIRDPLSEGRHNITVEAKDRAENLTVMHSIFYVSGGRR